MVLNFSFDSCTVCSKDDNCAACEDCNSATTWQKKNQQTLFQNWEIALVDACFQLLWTLRCSFAVQQLTINTRRSIWPVCPLNRPQLTFPIVAGHSTIVWQFPTLALIAQCLVGTFDKAIRLAVSLTFIQSSGVLNVLFVFLFQFSV